MKGHEKVRRKVQKLGDKVVKDKNTATGQSQCTERESSKEQEQCKRTEQRME